MTIQQINEWRERNHLTPFYTRQQAKLLAGRKDGTATIHYLEDALRSFEASPKKVGNRQHLEMLLSTKLTKAHAFEIAWEGSIYA